MNMEHEQNSWCDSLKWPQDGLLPAIAQDVHSRRILMIAWMTPVALQATIDEGRAVYWSRSRGRLWRKGEQSGHVQHVREVRIDCDADAILLLVEQEGQIACHTGRQSCFYRKLENGNWVEVDPVLKSPEKIYQNEKE